MTWTTQIQEPRVSVERDGHRMELPVSDVFRLVLEYDGAEPDVIRELYDKAMLAGADRKRERGIDWEI